MEIKTCEEYVLHKLFETEEHLEKAYNKINELKVMYNDLDTQYHNEKINYRNEIARLNDKIAELECQLSKLND